MRDVRARGESVFSHVRPPPPIHTRQATHARRDARDGIECDTTRRLNVYRGWSHRLANGQSCWPHERLAPLGEEAFCACEQSVSETQKQKQTRPLLRRIHRAGAWIINPGKPRQGSESGSECLARAICKILSQALIRTLACVAFSLFVFVSEGTQGSRTQGCPSTTSVLRLWRVSFFHVLACHCMNAVRTCTRRGMQKGRVQARCCAGRAN